jgi:hypothetical protein
MYCAKKKKKTQSNCVSLFSTNIVAFNYYLFSCRFFVDIFVSIIVTVIVIVVIVRIARLIVVAFFDLRRVLEQRDNIASNPRRTQHATDAPERSKQWSTNAQSGC